MGEALERIWRWVATGVAVVALLAGIGVCAVGLGLVFMAIWIDEALGLAS